MLAEMYLNGEFGPNPDEVNPYASSAFFAVDRFAAWAGGLGGFYDAGGIVICDRYTTSNMIYMACKLADPLERAAFLEWVWDLEITKLGLPEPFKVFFLDTSPEQSSSMVLARSQQAHTERDIHERDESYLERTYALGLELAGQYGWESVRCIEDGALMAPDAICGRIYGLLAQALEAAGPPNTTSSPTGLC
jgi:dTMP kinase